MEAENYKFYKQNDTDTIWWIGTAGSKGEYLFAFDKVKIYNLFRDYPYELAPEQIAIFKKENPYWAKFFQDREPVNHQEIQYQTKDKR